MISVANLDPVHFEHILSGAKRTERRLRKRLDPRLEAIAPGETLWLLECGTSRAIRATVVTVLRFDHPDYPHLYAIRLARPELTTATVRKIQGWSRRASL